MTLRQHPAFAIAAATLLAAHIAVIVRQPAGVDGFLYLINACALCLSTALLFARARRNLGSAHLRWTILAASVATRAGAYVYAAYRLLLHRGDFSFSLVLTSFTVFLCMAALTAPVAGSASRVKIVDGLTAALLCALQISVVVNPELMVRSGTGQLVEYTVVGMALVLFSIFGAMAADAPEMRFYRAAIVFFGILAVTSALANWIGDELLNQPAGWFTLPVTFGQLAFAVYILRHVDARKNGSLPDPPVQRPSALVCSLLPFSISCALIALSVLFTRPHPWLGWAGLICGIASLLYRAAGTQVRLRQGVDSLEEQNFELAAIANSDPLTGLGNRRSFYSTLSAQLSHQDSADVHLLVLDLDYFKEANDAGGHLYGDRCLIAVASALRHGVPSTVGSVFRLGGDEFAVLFSHPDCDAALALAYQLCDAVERLALKAGGHTVTASVGVARAAPGMPADTLVHNADVALYRAKAEGRSTACFFSESPGQIG